MCLHHFRVNELNGIDAEFMKANYVVSCSLCGKESRANHVDDGFHTFAELYRHRTALFAALANKMGEKAWKAKLHYDGTMFDGDWFIAGIETPEGMATYHIEGRYWDAFKVPEVQRAPPWDGHSPDDVLERLATI